MNFKEYPEVFLPAPARFANRVMRVVDVVALTVSALAVAIIFAIQVKVSIANTFFTPFSLVEESAYTFTSANNYLTYGYLNSGLLQDFSSSSAAQDHPYLYNHMPPGPDVANALLLQLLQGDYAAARLVFAMVALAGFGAYCAFGMKFLAQFGLRGAGLLLLIPGPWVIIQLMERQIYSAFLLLAFLPMLLFLLYARDGRRALFCAALALIFLSSLIIEYSALLGVAGCWAMLFLTQLMPINFRQIVLVGAAFAAGVVLHLLQNMFVLGWSAFVAELNYTLSNRITGFPTQESLEQFYRSLGVVHHGSHPIDLGVIKTQLLWNLTFPGMKAALATLVFLAVALLALGALRPLSRGPAGSPRMSFLTAELLFVGRILVWILGTVTVPILVFPAFAQEVNLRGSGASLFFVALAAVAILASAFRLLCYLLYRGATIVAAPGRVEGPPSAQVDSAGAAVAKLASVVALCMSALGIAAGLSMFGVDTAAAWKEQLTSVYAQSKVPHKWEPLEEVRRFRGNLFMTNINVPTVGFLTQAPGFGVCAPEAVGDNREIALKHCKVGFMRRFDFWASQRPRYFYYFEAPSLFPGFADCLPATTLVGQERGGAACMEQLLSRLSRQYRLVLQNPFVRVFDLQSTADAAKERDAVPAQKTAR
jgi:hypothetical protein